MSFDSVFTRRSLLALSVAGSLAGATAASYAQTYPSKPVRLVVGGPAGGTVDMSARMLADKLAVQLGQTVLVENKPGAAGLLGTQELLKSPRDGYTLMVGLNALVSEVPHIMKMPFDPFKAIKPLAEIGRTGLVLVTNSQVPATDLSSFVNYVRANKGKVSFASYSPGTVSHTLGLELNKLAGLDMMHVGYRGSPPALQDLIGGSVQAMFDGVGNVTPHVKSGKLKALATTAGTRSPLLPDVPTFAELGYKNLTETVWIGVWSTTDLPEPLQARVREATLKALQDGKLRDNLATIGMTPGTGATPDELMASLRDASNRQAAMLQAIGFKPE